MANTYTQIHIQSVFAVKRRAALLHKDLATAIVSIHDWNNELFRAQTAGGEWHRRSCPRFLWSQSNQIDLRYHANVKRGDVVMD